MRWLTLFLAAMGVTAIGCVLIHYVPKRYFERAQRYGLVGLGCLFAAAATSEAPNPWGVAGIALALMLIAYYLGRFDVELEREERARKWREEEAQRAVK
jgi:hypothetical protein